MANGLRLDDWTAKSGLTTAVIIIIIKFYPCKTIYRFVVNFMKVLT
jgi:hypothetical protein